MSEPVYCIPQEFIRIAALDTRGTTQSDPSDPNWLNVRTTLFNNTDAIEDIVYSPSCKQIRKVQTGLWLFYPNCGMYTTGQQYVCNWRFAMTPGNLNVARKNFTWNPIPEWPRNPEHCIVYGMLSDAAGVPVAGQAIVIEKYNNYVTLNNKTGENRVISDTFGYWQLEMPQNSIVRIVFGDLIKVISVPEINRAALSDIKEYQPRKEQVDTFGYPYPRGG